MLLYQCICYVFVMLVTFDLTYSFSCLSPRRVTAISSLSMQLSNHNHANVPLSVPNAKPAAFFLTASTCVLFPIIASATTGDSSSLSVPLNLEVTRTVIDVFVNTLSVFFIFRTVLSWYPKTDLKQPPFSIIAWPTEPLLQPVRELIPPAFGVDISAIIWIMVLSFFREILTGQQGILTLLEKSG